MQEYVWVIKYDAVEYYETIGTFTSEKLAQDALEALGSSYKFHCHIERELCNKVDERFLDNSDSVSSSGDGASYPLALNAGVLYANVDLSLLLP